jgi:DNA invertase Pin-like site-specific DNA recombinase
MLRQLRPGDVVVVWKIDRLSRSLKDLLHVMERIEAAGAGFRSLTEAVDTTTPAGRMMMQMVGAFAEFERAMIRERTSAGLAQARAEGRIGGRRRKLSEKQRAEIAEGVLSGRRSAAEMAAFSASPSPPSAGSSRSGGARSSVCPERGPKRLRQPPCHWTIPQPPCKLSELRR